MIPVLTLIAREADAAGSAKSVFRTADDRLVEGVRFYSGTTVNLCLSSQAGCPYRCTHCATGLLGFARNLTSDEMLDQALHMSEGGPFDPLFLGQGEPFLNLDEVLRALDLMVERGLVRSPRSALMGTSGVAKGWTTLAARMARPMLSVSIHGVPDIVRVRVVPHTTAYSLAALERDLHAYQRRTADAVTLNYTPLAGVNDSDENFSDFADFASRFDCVVRIIPYNGVPALGHRPADAHRHDVFTGILDARGVRYIQRPSAAVDVLGGCGQLGLLGRGARSIEGAQADALP
jgi:23S rRNA (adenine2503-C2)-methyltransferase